MPKGGASSSYSGGVPYKDPEVRKRKAHERYMRHREEAIAAARQQRAEKKEEISAQRKAKYASRPPEWREAFLEYQRAWHDQRPGYAAESGRRRRMAHPEDLAYFAQWRRDHPEAVRAYASQRRGRAVEGMTAQDKQESIEWRRLIADDPCFYCGTTDADVYEDDHYVSIANGGTDHWWNLVRACRPCNRAKAMLNGDEFLERRRREPGNYELPLTGTASGRAEQATPRDARASSPGCCSYA